MRKTRTDTFSLAYNNTEAKEYREIHQRGFPGDTFLIRELQQIPITGRSVLDYGCGDGRLAPLFIKMGAQRVVCCDPSAAMILVSKRASSQKGISVDLLKNIPTKYKGKSFDIIICHYVLHYIPDISRVSKEFVRLLKPGGILIAVLSDVVVDKRHQNLINTILPLVFDEKMQARTFLRNGKEIKRQIMSGGLMIKKYELIANASVASILNNYPYKDCISLRTALLVAQRATK